MPVGARLAESCFGYGEPVFKDTALHEGYQGVFLRKPADAQAYPRGVLSASTAMGLR
jgi:hypothetical protein